MNKDIFCKGYTWGFFSKRGDFQTEAAEKSMERLASNGLNWICIPVNALQESFASTRVFSDYERTQSDEDIAFAMERLLEAGALDVYTVPIGMKKSRPGVMLCVLCREEQREEMARLLLRHTTTLGVRESRHRRYTLSRAEETVDTPWGPVARKLSQGWGVRRQKPEYEDLARIAREQDLPLEQVRQQIR